MLFLENIDWNVNFFHSSICLMQRKSCWRESQEEKPTRKFFGEQPKISPSIPGPCLEVCDNECFGTIVVATVSIFISLKLSNTHWNTSCYVLGGYYIFPIQFCKTEHMNNGAWHRDLSHISTKLTSLVT